MHRQSKKNKFLHCSNACDGTDTNTGDDQDQNVILSMTHEYRQPSDAAIRDAIAESAKPSATLPLTSRFVGLVVVPGEHITKIEYEESPFSRDTVHP
jgi:N-alpha-acetyltransferase 38, NatC auxiliary subunit